MRRWARPARPVAPIAVAVAILGIWWLVAHNGGSGWVQALGDIVFGTLVIGILGPGVVLARAKVAVVDAPFHGTAGLPARGAPRSLDTPPRATCQSPRGGGLRGAGRRSPSPRGPDLPSPHLSGDP